MIQQDSTDPTGVRSEKRTPSAERARQRKAKAATQLRVEGHDWEEIAEILGYPTARAALVATEKTLEDELKSPETRDYMRDIAKRRYDKVMRSVLPKASDPDHPEHLTAVSKFNELAARQAKLLGLDAATEHVVYSPSQQEIEAWVATQINATVPQLEEADIFGTGEIVQGEIVEEA